MIEGWAYADFRHAGAKKECLCWAANWLAAQFSLPLQSMLKSGAGVINTSTQKFDYALKVFRGPMREVVVWSIAHRDAGGESLRVRLAVASVMGETRFSVSSAFDPMRRFAFFAAKSVMNFLTLLPRSKPLNTCWASVPRCAGFSHEALEPAVLKFLSQPIPTRHISDPAKSRNPFLSLLQNEAPLFNGIEALKPASCGSAAGRMALESLTEGNRGTHALAAPVVELIARSLGVAYPADKTLAAVNKLFENRLRSITSDEIAGTWGPVQISFREESDVLYPVLKPYERWYESETPEGNAAKGVRTPEPSEAPSAPKTPNRKARRISGERGGIRKRLSSVIAKRSRPLLRKENTSRIAALNDRLGLPPCEFSTTLDRARALGQWDAAMEAIRLDYKSLIAAYEAANRRTEKRKCRKAAEAELRAAKDAKRAEAIQTLAETSALDAQPEKAESSPSALQPDADSQQESVASGDAEKQKADLWALSLLDALQKEAQSLRERIHSAEAKAESWRRAYESTLAQKSELDFTNGLELIRASDAKASGAAELLDRLFVMPDREPSPEECLELIEALHGDRVTVLDEARESASDCSDFRAGRRLMSLLVRLATKYVDALRTGGDSAAKSVFTPYEYAPQEADRTLASKENVRRRSMVWRGRELFFRRHLRVRSRSGSKTALRVYFDWVPEEGRIVIGRCGSHFERDTN